MRKRVPPAFEFEIFNQTEGKVHKARLTKDLLKIPKRLRRWPKNIIGLNELEKSFSFHFVSTAQIKKLNSKFRNKNKSTDVLTFAGDFHEIFLCPEVLKRQAKENAHNFYRETLYLCIHGVLHAMGYDHERGLRDERQMFELQDWLFEQIR